MSYPTVDQIAQWIYNEGQKKDVKDPLIGTHLIALISDTRFLGLTKHVDLMGRMLQAKGATVLDYAMEQTAFGILLGLQMAKTFQEEELVKCQVS